METSERECVCVWRVTEGDYGERERVRESVFVCGG